MLHGLAEADARIDGDAVGYDAGRACGVDALRKMRGHFGDDIIIVRILLHGARCASHVHENNGACALRRDVRHIIIALQRRDIVDDLRAGRDGGARHRCLRGVDAQRGSGFRGESFDDRKHAAQFLFRGDGGRAGARRLAADIEDLRAFVDKA